MNNPANMEATMELDEQYAADRRVSAAELLTELPSIEEEEAMYGAANIPDYTIEGLADD
jgi:hypothetical protein